MACRCGAGIAILDGGQHAAAPAARRHSAAPLHEATLSAPCAALQRGYTICLLQKALLSQLSSCRSLQLTESCRPVCCSYCRKLEMEGQSQQPLRHHSLGEWIRLKPTQTRTGIIDASKHQAPGRSMGFQDRPCHAGQFNAGSSNTTTSAQPRCSHSKVCLNCCTSLGSISLLHCVQSMGSWGCNEASRQEERAEAGGCSTRLVGRKRCLLPFPRVPG